VVAWDKRRGVARSRARERETARSRERGWEVAHGLIAAGRAGLHGTKAHAGHVWLSRLVGPVGLGDGPDPSSYMMNNGVIYIDILYISIKIT
jgi:hypothetical protein